MAAVSPKPRLQRHGVKFQPLAARQPACYVGNAMNETTFSSSTTKSWWRLPILLAIVLAAIVTARVSGCGEQEHSAGPMGKTEPVADPKGRTVSLTIDYGDDRKRQFDAIPWHAGMTVDDQLTAASRLPNGVTYTVRGYKERALLTQIDKVENEGGGQRNWLYSVNNVKAEKSFAIYELQPGDRVLWVFGREE
jgi:hypothetical protein